jgi:hypothetical protein
MPRYYHLTGGVVDKGPIPLPAAWKNVSGLDKATPAMLKSLGWLPEVQIGNDSFDPNTQIKTGPDVVVGTDEVTATWTIRNMTAQELAQVDRDRARNFIREAALDTAQVLITLVDTLLAKNVIAPTDFDVATRVLYQQLKVRVDKLR